MSNRLVAHLALALAGAFCAAPALAQNPGPNNFTHPRPRAGQLRARNGPAAPGMFFGRADSQPTPPRLGVMVSDEDDGVVVSEVMDDSLASSAGLQADDVIYKIAGERVDQVSDIPEILGRFTEPGEDVEITVIRAGEGLVTLTGTRPEPPPAPEPIDPRTADGNRGAFLGVQLGEVDNDRVRIDGVIDGSAAWFLGLEQGDLLVSLEDQACSTPEVLAASVAAHAPGDMVSLVWQRGDDTMSGQVRLGQRQPQGAAGFPFGPMGMPPMPDMPRMHFGNRPGGGRFQFFTGDDDRAIDMDEMEEWVREMQQQFQGQPGESHSLSIEIKDGKMYIDRDGDVEVRDLGEDGGRPDIFRHPKARHHEHADEDHQQGEEHDADEQHEEHDRAGHHDDHNGDDHDQQESSNPH